jgi:hypothetical protein
VRIGYGLQGTMDQISLASISSGEDASGSVRLSVCFDASAGETLRQLLLANPALFQESAPAAADVVVFGSDEASVVTESVLFSTYKSKSLCITETDTPTFLIPGLYSANEKSYITRARTTTVNYLISERNNANPEIKKLSGPSLERRYLYSFMGGSNCWPRKRLFRSLRTTADTLIESTDSYNHWTNNPNDRDARAAQMRRYAEVMAASKYALCPRGCGLSSYRLFEAMSLGVAPVIISDKWQPTQGVDWRFALFLPERHIGDIDRIVRSHESEWQERGNAALAAYRTTFAGDAVARTINQQMIQLLSAYSPARERVMRVALQLRIARKQSYHKIYTGLKFLILSGFYHCGLSFPFVLHEPLEQQVRRRR